MRIEAKRSAAEARQYLGDTDWMVTRMAETGVPVPDDVRDKRAAARAILSKGQGQ
jgi:hypothetical protein